MSRRTIGIGLIATSAASFGAMAILARLAYDAGADVTTTLFLRFSIAAVVLAVILQLRRRPCPRGRVLGSLIAMGAIGYVGQSLAFFTGLTVAPAALIALLLYVYPALVTVLAAVLFREPLTRTKIVALAVATAGTALTIGLELGGNPAGVVYGLGAAVIYAGYILIGSRVTPRAGPLAATTVIVASAAVVYGVLVLVRGPSWPTTASGWGAIVAMALVSTVVAITTFFAGMERLGVAEASTLSTIEPAITVVLAALVLGEPILPLQVVGGSLILAAVVVLARAPRPTSRLPLRTGGARGASD